jgi:UDP-sugar transporter A1/2/3
MWTAFCVVLGLAHTATVVNAFAPGKFNLRLRKPVCSAQLKQNVALWADQSESISSDSSTLITSVVEPEKQNWFLRNRPYIILITLACHKAVTDSLTQWTRRTTVYNGGNVSLLAELAKYPMLALAISIFVAPKAVGSSFKTAKDENPLSMIWIALCYSIQNLLYFPALSNLSAASYQILSQSKLLFTAGFMTTVLKKKLQKRQILAIFGLCVGSLLVQLAEVSTSTVVGGSAIYGGFCAILGAICAALPNVHYEKLLKTDGEDEWARNIQITTWISTWTAGSVLMNALRGGTLSTFLNPKVFLEGFTPAVWLIVLLKSLNGLLIPLTLKYADNMIYSYAKPTSIVLTCIAGSIYTGIAPSAKFVAGAALVIASMASY